MTAFLKGIDASHSGIEIEGAISANDMLTFNFAAGFGNWVYTDDASGDIRTYGAKDTTITTNFYIKDLKVGDAPQTQMAIGATLLPYEGILAQIVIKNYSNHSADFNPFTRTDSNDRAQSWVAPNYNVIDLHAKYDLPINLGNTRMQAFLHVFNLLDEVYIQDAVDNSKYNAWDKDHDADDAEVYFGLPMSWNIGVTVHF